jgi:hypothetical protein
LSAIAVEDGEQACSGADDGPWRQFEVLQETLGQLKLGLNRAKGNTDLGANDAPTE